MPIEDGTEINSNRLLKVTIYVVCGNDATDVIGEDMFQDDFSIVFKSLLNTIDEYAVVHITYILSYAILRHRFEKFCNHLLIVLNLHQHADYNSYSHQHVSELRIGMLA